MTVFVDENRDEFGVEPVLRGVAELPRPLITSTNGGCGNPNVARPAAGGIGELRIRIRRVWESNFGE